MHFSFLRTVVTVGGWTLASRLAGFIRDMLAAALLGAGPTSDAFFVALKLPNLFRRLFGEGAFSVAFVPLYNAELAARGDVAANDFAQRTLSILLPTLLIATTVIILAMPWVMLLLAPGFVDDPARFPLAVQLSRITFPYLLLMSLVVLYGGILNSLGSFSPFAAAPIAFNLLQIGGMGFAWWVGADIAQALAVSVTLSGVVQLLWMVSYAWYQGVRLRLLRPRLCADTRRLLKLMGPAAIGSGVMQANVLVDMILATLLPTGAVTWLYYADRLNQLPLGVVGVAIGTALLPVLSRHVQRGNTEAVSHYLSRGIEIGLLFTLPAAIGLIVAAEPIIATIFQRGAFTLQDTRATAVALQAFASGVPAYVLVKILSTAFFAHQDTAGPVKFAIIAAVSNAVLGWILIHIIGHAGIGLATSLTAWLNLLLLIRRLHGQGQLTLLDRRVFRNVPRLFAAALGMGGALSLGLQYLIPVGSNPGFSAITLTAILGSTAILYILLAWLADAINIADLSRMLSRKEDQS